jgi:hypothetical protein
VRSILDQGRAGWDAAVGFGRVMMEGDLEPLFDDISRAADFFWNRHAIDRVDPEEVIT